MTPAGILLRDEVERAGPVSFARFMEVALYHPEHGYYRKRDAGSDPFGKGGDFYTASQLQPVFGILIGSIIRRLFEEMGRPPDFQVVELGAGRQEMAPFLSEWNYTPIDAGEGSLPGAFRGVVFANEFFDALPVDVVVRRGDELVERLVGFQGERFVWVDGAKVSGEVAEILTRFGEPREEGDVLEVCTAAPRQVEHIADRMRDGYLVAIDYGYTARETMRFPAGTLMSYRSHQALDDVLAEPGMRDITAHVNFTALQEHFGSRGWETVHFESMASLLLRAGEKDQFAAALAVTEPEEEQRRRRLQLKTLLYGMGESFRALTLRRGK